MKLNESNGKILEVAKLGIKQLKMELTEEEKLRKTLLLKELDMTFESVLEEAEKLLLKGR